MHRFLAALALLTVAAPVPASALCTCMIRRKPPSRLPVPETPLLSDASLVVLMREGRRTVLTMRVDYQGPPEDFAMLVPVPEVLEPGQVRTLEPGALERLDRLSAPRLVEYWERNPCGDSGRREATRRAPRMAGVAGATGDVADALAGARPPPVRVEASYAVDEYDVTILSAGDSAGLLRWLDDAGYALPDRAEPILRSYIEQGTKFFLARVSGERLALRNGRGRLAPLQFHYESDSWELPIRLGLLNSPGRQDVVVLALSHRGRVAVANRPNAIVPTNLELPSDARERFPALYAGLLDQLLRTQRGAVVTEFASEVRDELSATDARALGADRIPSRNPSGFTLTRLHYRYEDDQRPDDLAFTYADAIGGGDGQPTADGELGAMRAEARLTNGFRARYAIFHRFDGATACAAPVRGRWGGPRPGEAPTPIPTDVTPASALDVDTLARMLGDQLGEAGLGLSGAGKRDAAASPTIGSSKEKPELLAHGSPAAPAPKPIAGGCACDAAVPNRPGHALWSVLMLGLILVRRRSR